MGSVVAQSIPNLPLPPFPAPTPPSPSNPTFSSIPSLDLRIILDFPDISAEFRSKRFSLLWRSSRDDFKAKEFHRRCDGDANTQTVILDTEGNIFCEFTPVEWGSVDGCYRADES
jgi:hypothetical protein